MAKQPLQARPAAKARIGGGSGKIKDIGDKHIDSTTNAMMTVDYTHHEVHSGSHYYLQGFVDLAINAVYDMQFTTPDTTKWCHFLESLNVESETDWYIYEGATIITPGTPLLPVNNNRNSSKVSGVVAAAIQNSSLALANSDTDVSGATLISSGRMGSGRGNPSGDSRHHELILKQNTIYCMRAVANAAGYVDFDASWYEHTNK